jgi:hypothetical protein
MKPDEIKEEILRDFKKEFTVKLQPEWIAGNIPTAYMEKWLSKAIDRIREDERKNINLTRIINSLTTKS